jgi:hypothetical protein
MFTRNSVRNTIIIIINRNTNNISQTGTSRGSLFSKKAISMKTEMTLPFKLESCYTVIFPQYKCYEECIQETLIKKVSHEDFLEEYKNYPKELKSNFENISIKDGKRSCYTGILTFDYFKGTIYVNLSLKNSFFVKIT